MLLTSYALREQNRALPLRSDCPERCVCTTSTKGFTQSLLSVGFTHKTLSVRQGGVRELNNDRLAAKYLRCLQWWRYYVDMTLFGLGDIYLPKTRALRCSSKRRSRRLTVKLCVPAHAHYFRRSTLHQRRTIQWVLLDCYGSIIYAAEPLSSALTRVIGPALVGLPR